MRKEVKYIRNIKHTMAVQCTLLGCNICGRVFFAKSNDINLSLAFLKIIYDGLSRFYIQIEF